MVHYLQMNGLDSLFDSFFYSTPKKGEVPPSVTEYITGEDGEVEAVEIQMALSGFEKEDIEITAEDRTLTITGNNHNKKGISDKFKQAFSRNWILKDTLDLSKMEGSLENGLLTVRIPFKEIKKDKYTLSLK